MKIGIMQPYFFPYIGYWQLINAVDIYVIYDDVNFMKKGWINRNNILINGQPKLINLQMSKASQNKLINEIELLGNETYNAKLLKTIKASYKKAPYYEEVFPLIKNIIEQDEKNLAKFLTESMVEISKYLGIKTKFVMSSDIEKNNSLRGQDKIIETCKLLNADVYINSIGGRDLYLQKDFHSNGIKLKFLKANKIKYKQFNNEFIPNLSIVDVLMFNATNGINHFLEEYELI